MITDINSLISGQGKTNSTQTNSPSIGALAKLSSELKLIQGMQPIQITSVQNSQSANGQTAQLISVTQNNQQRLTLVNQEANPNIKAGDRGVLNVAAQSATLTVTPSSTANTSSRGPYGSSANSATGSVNNSTQTPQQVPSGNSQSSNTGTTTQAPQPLIATQTSAKITAQVAIASQPIQLTVLQTSANSTSSTGATSAATTAQPAQAGQQPSTAPTTPSPNQFSATVTDGKETFTLNTRHPLQPGDTLSVVVDKQGKLQFLPQTTSTPTQATITEGLKQSLPKQITPQEFTTMLRQLTTMAQSGSQLPERVSQALEQLIRQLPNLQSLTQSPDSLKQALQTSGTFSERNLSTNTLVPQDLKLNLTRLDGATNDPKTVSQLNSASSTQTQVLNQVAGAIERITTHQLRNIVENVQQDGQNLPLSIELPIKDGRSTSLVNIRIDRDNSQDQDVEPHNRRWLVQLKFEFEETGKFEARVSVQDQKVGVIFAVEQAETEQLIRGKLDDLKESLRQKNVEIETMDCFRAQLKEPSKSPYDSPSTRLIDVRT
ncbi:flagellar hook-length control protein FliK [Rhodanobacter aciditrophus]|uniref:Flagellar hook-length control protein FliK n=1 Tax=Rhodanobacter aciditrophus TaxID=1623218 RepID=A0ABW4B3Y2_9GAMM